MNTFNSRLARLRALLLVALVALVALPLVTVAHAAVQRREHLTEEETDMVRVTQALDQRIAVFIKIAERRVDVVTGVAASTPALVAKDAEKWGALPKGTRAQLLGDIARILDEAINNIDDVAARTPDSSLVPKSLRRLSEASAQFLPQLAALRTGTAAENEREALEQAIDNLEEIIEAAKRLPTETTEKKDEKKGEKKKN
ncbi:MAG TPA: hypothetical protein VGW12_02695 [Pyrinomonadaceae bacterium]|nr:hypothetical protein [Pyrinomonadaceae bacterium]